jgi:tetratricopeptide (TPR) repeat protein
MEEVTFTSIPIEIRLKIYSYLLLDQNCVTLKRLNNVTSIRSALPILRPSFATPLFRVNKQISDETLHYFFTQNMFVGIEMNNEFMLRKCRNAVPIFINKDSETEGFKDCALKLRYQASRVDWSTTFAEWEKPFEYAIIAGRHLPNLVRIINGDHSLNRKSEASIRIDLEFRAKTGFFSGNNKVTMRLVEGCKGLRRIPQENVSLGKLALTIHGDVSPAQIEEILVATNSPDPDFLTVIVEGREALIRGSRFLVAKDYSAAHGELFIADHLTGHRMWEIGEDLELLSKLRKLSIDIQIHQSLLESLQNRHAEAAGWAHQAWATASAITWGQVSDVDKAHIKLRLAQAFFDDEKYAQAERELRHAHRLDPNNEQVKKLLKKTEGNVLKQKKY